jgi:alcohol dehydrogenase class IV
MLKEMDIPLSISQLGNITEEEYMAAIPAMADAAIADACTATNPRHVTRADVMQIYRDLW